MENKLIWLASYPKSGNTWFRSFITALEKGEVDINRMATQGIFSSKLIWEEILDTDFDDLRSSEIEVYRKQAIHYFLSEGEKPRFLKVHDAYSYSKWDGKPIIADPPAGFVIYLVRNPMDVVLSFANHNNQSVDQTIDKFICNESAGFVKRNHSWQQSYQLLSTWSKHAESWMFQQNIPVKALRYEDMKEHSLEAFHRTLEAAGLHYSPEQVQQALDLVQFEKLQEQEASKGFNEKPYSSMKFFHKGQTGRWKQELDSRQIQRIMQCSEKMMKYFGYWEEAKKHLIEMNSWVGPK
ncbi:MAG: sulfotransferase domain-containing protein [Lunatimonas sp.]|uniref:sulfotransferase domain-containing protein n=1 Tax=Lunatimonas sp. TaxID=2060141 RepID=UPI00263B2C95|nr:sulfotransferase domain-containing protein [Lunatimonas sp.]MCC5937002.1 sulfotransferase domain-containing protein [Lunatimonas sp.]